MRKLLLIITLLLIVGCGNGSVNQSRVDQITTIGQGPVTFYVHNESSLTAQEVNAYIDAQNIQLQRDFKPHWGIDCVMVNQEPPDTVSFSLNFLSDFSRFPQTEARDYGLHDPSGHAFVNGATAFPVGYGTLAASHEVLETLVNPHAEAGRREVADPVQETTYGINGLLFTDFVLPSYDVPGSSGPWDFTGVLSGPLTVAPGGHRDKTYGP